MHYVETKLSRQPNKNTLQNIKEIYPLIKLGAFNKDEDDIIRKYWYKFKQVHKINNNIRILYLLLIIILI